MKLEVENGVPVLDKVGASSKSDGLGNSSEKPQVPVKLRPENTNVPAEEAEGNVTMVVRTFGR